MGSREPHTMHVGVLSSSNHAGTEQSSNSNTGSHPERVSFQKVGEDGVFAGGFAARKHPAPQSTEMMLIFSKGMNAE